VLYPDYRVVYTRLVVPFYTFSRGAEEERGMMRRVVPLSPQE